MSFRRRSAALTDEDLEVWWAKVHRGDDPHTIGTLGIHSIESDRRDADLMFIRESHWEREGTPPIKWWFEDWPFPDFPPRTRTVFDAALYYWM